MRAKNFIAVFIGIIVFFACKKELDNKIAPTKYNFPSISNFRTLNQDPNNIMTEEGIQLGYRLFFDPILSKNFSQSCASCHQPEHGFSDPRKLSIGVDGNEGTRQAMPIINLAWHTRFFWDGRDSLLREQALEPVPNPIEMHLEWTEAVIRLNNIEQYKVGFERAFGTRTITKELVVKALEQYEKALINYNSPFDKFQRGEVGLSESALRGREIFNTERGDCFHCHSTTPAETTVNPARIFANNGLDEIDNLLDFEDIGLGKTTGNISDNGKFKIPSLRNLSFTAPYMHDGRFATLDEVIENYNQGPKISPSLEPIMLADANKRILLYGRFGLGLTVQEKEDLKAFLLSFTDSTVLTNPLFLPPNL
jgi:cytochrome c peroxidase